MRKIMMLLLAVSLLLAMVFPAAAEGKGDPFEGFDMEILPADPEASEAPAGTEGLAVTPGAWTIDERWEGVRDGVCVRAALDVQIMNWTFSALSIQDSLSAELTFRGRTVYEAGLSFSLESLGMLERLDGQLVFRIPWIVAQAQPEDLLLTIRALGEDTVIRPDFSEALAALHPAPLPFHYENAEIGGFEIAAGDAALAQSFGGVEDEVSLWLVQPVRIANWSAEPLDLEANGLAGTVVFMDRYAFRGQLQYDRNVIAPLEIADILLAVRVPLAVTEAEAGLVRLNVTLAAETFTQDLPMDEIRARSTGCTVENVTGAAYGFNLRDDGWYESANAGVADSYAICVVRFRSMSGSVTITYNNSGESGCDYGMVSRLDAMLELNGGTTNALTTFGNRTDTVRIAVPDTEEHFVCLKYKKDSSYNNGHDSLRFRVDGLDLYPSRRPLNSYAVETVYGAAYGFALNGSGWYESTNKGQSDTFAICVIRFRTNAGRIALECTNNGESGCDYGMISPLDTMLGLDTGTGDTLRTFGNTSDTVVIDVPDTEEHFVCLKYRKDSSYSNDIDSLSFRVLDFD